MKSRLDTPRFQTTTDKVTAQHDAKSLQKADDGAPIEVNPEVRETKAEERPHSTPGIFNTINRCIGAGAAAALLATSVGFGALPKRAREIAPPKSNNAMRLAAHLPNQRGAMIVQNDVHLPAAEDIRLMTSLLRIDRRVQSLALGNPRAFAGIMGQAFGDRLQSPAGKKLLLDLKAGRSVMPETIQVVEASALEGADAAYDAVNGRILLSATLINDSARLSAVLLEEVGHHLDARLGPGDAVGDEGHIFRIGMERGRLLTQPELQSGRLDRDHGVVEIGGVNVAVEFSTRAEDRAYEAAGSFSDADVKRGVEARLAEQIDAEVVSRAAAENPAIGDLEAAKAHFGEGFDAAKAEAEKAIVGADRDAYLKVLSADLVKEAVTSSVVVRLKVADVLPDDTTLDSPLPARTQARVDADEALSKVDPKIETWGALAQALAGDVDADGLLDFDAFAFSRFLPDVSAQDILRAVKAPITASDMREKLAAVGFQSPMLDGFSINSALELVPPKLYGLQGDTKIDKTQQQLLLRTGKVFVDSNENGKIDDADAVHFVDRDGSIKQTTYGELSDDLKKLVRLNMATAKVAEDYAALPAHRRMKFPHYEAATGKPGEERVNSTYWTISTAEANRGQTSWELKGNRDVRTIADVMDLLSSRNEEFKKVREAKVAELEAAGQDTSAHAVEVALIQDFKGERVKGHLPSEALDDLFIGNGGKYTTECAHGRTLIRLQGLQAYYKESFGDGLGAFKFDLLFAASGADKTKGEDYVKAFEAHRAANEGATWQDYVAANPIPEIDYAMEVSRHRVFGNNESVMEPFKRERVGAAAGDTGYFHNHSVSVEGVKIGYVGENVIDLGYKGGVRRYWGHPGGVQDEKSWQGELASSRISVDKMSEFGQYFSHTDTKRSSARVTKMRIQEIDKKIRQLQIHQPAGYEDQIKDLEGSKGWWKALDVTRKGLVDHLDRDQLEAADKLFSGHVTLRDADDAKPIYDLLTADGRSKVAAAFAELPKETHDAAVAHFGVGAVDDLDEAQKAQTVLQATLSQYGSMHSFLKDEARGIVTTERFLEKKDWLTGDGAMASKMKFAGWLQSDEFAAFYEEAAGKAWEGERDLAKMTLEQVRGIVELAFPMVKGKRTVYAEVNRGAQLLSNQMAKLLKEGKLPNAEYRVDSMAVAPLE